MSELHTFKIPAHKNIYLDTSDRELRIDFSIPHNGVNDNTGILILVPGFGGNIDSNVYRKMRETFADLYNVVTLQCDYFGSAYMQMIDNFKIKDSHILQNIFNKEELEALNQQSSTLVELLKEKDVMLPVEANIAETLDEFNDMGYMQAIDIITAIKALKFVLNDNGLVYNTKRIIGYGHSHGAYLLHLSNILAPNLFSFIIDNSAWIEPVYLTSNRSLYHKVGKATICVEYSYLAKKIVKNNQRLNLKNLYKNYSGNTQILCFQGDNDKFVDFKEKRDFVETIKNSKFILVTEKDIDNQKYKSNTHGLDADFLELFAYALEYEIPNKRCCGMDLKYKICFEDVQIDVDNSLELPVFDFIFEQGLK